MFQVRDIVMMKPGYRPAGAYVITAIKPRPKNPYNALSLNNRKTYRLSDDCLVTKRAGVADEAFLSTDTILDRVETENQQWEEGQNHAKRMALLTNDEYERRRWEYLATRLVGNTITVSVRGQQQPAVFHTVLVRGQKYVFLAARHGKLHKYPLHCVVLPNTV